MTKRRGPKGKPLTVRGVTYPSQKEAARALGVGEPAICVAKQRGTLDTVGCRKTRNQHTSEKEADQ